VAVWGIPLLVGLTILGGWPFRAMVALVGVLALREAFALLCPRRSALLIWPVLSAAVVLPLWVGPQEGHRLAAILVGALLLVSGTALSIGPPAGARVAASALGLLIYPLLPLLHLSWTREVHGAPMVLLLLALLWIGDTAAYAGGRATGRHPLAASLSPHKTVEGAIWALGFSLATGIGTFLLWVEPRPAWSWFLLAAVTVWLFGMFGDLFESLLKRSADVKDSSHLLWEHGGVLDRFDSLLFATVPLYYLGYWLP
jgi:phosphatidate cytidylyltransferase